MQQQPLQLGGSIANYSAKLPSFLIYFFSMTNKRKIKKEKLFTILGLFSMQKNIEKVVNYHIRSLLFMQKEKQDSMGAKDKSCLLIY